jgi:pSer/pThr/pTyr-binding forkhead associated (FHA) protein
MLADTRVQPAAPSPKTYSASIPAGARLFRVGSGEAVAIFDGYAMIGRDRESDLVVSGPAVSRRHSIVRRSMRGYVLTDVSRNGTFVNGRRVRGTRLLRAGDVLRIGDEEFRFDVNRATPYAGVTLPALLDERVAQLRTAVPRLAEHSRRIAAGARLRAEPLLARLRNASRLAWATLLRTFWTMWARAAFAWRARGRSS